MGAETQLASLLQPLLAVDVLGIDIKVSPEGAADLIKAFIPIAAFVVALLVGVLALSQWRDVRRLKAWSKAEPEYPAKDLAASEAILDRAERELEVLLAEPEDVAEVAAAIEPYSPPTTEHQIEPGATGEYPITAAHRVTSERPALERLEIERAALDPHPRWHRIGAKLARPKLLAVLGLVVVLGAAAMVIGVDKLTTFGSGGGQEETTAPDGVPVADFTVAILNGATGVDDPAADIVEKLENNGIPVTGEQAKAPNKAEQSVVMFTSGHRTSAIRVAGTLGIEAIQPIDRPTEKAAGDADVVVVIGQNMVR